MHCDIKSRKAWLRDLMPGTGFHLGASLTEEQREAIAFGYRMVKEITRLEIGQLVVVKRGVVLAVEGFEGTDRCLQRGGELAGNSGDAVAVKAARLKHDMRFDIPCVGLKTLQTCSDAGVSVLALEDESFAGPGGDRSMDSAPSFGPDDRGGVARFLAG